MAVDTHTRNRYEEGARLNTAGVGGQRKDVFFITTYNLGYLYRGEKLVKFFHLIYMFLSLS